MATDLELADKHKYVTRAGEKPSPGVTTVINLLHKDLQWGAAKETAKIALGMEIAPQPSPRPGERRYDWMVRQFNLVWKGKSSLGTAIHQHALDWAHGRDVHETPRERPYLDALERFTQDHRPDWIVLEGIVLRGDNRQLAYGGRLDFIAQLGSEIVLGDFKTGKQFLAGPTLQLAAYRFAEGTPV